MEYLYPKNLKTRAKLWLWSLRDCVILGIAGLIAVLAAVYLHTVLLAAATLCYGFITIRLDDITFLDYLGWAARYFLTTQQKYFWR